MAHWGNLSKHLSKDACLIDGMTS